MLFINVNKVKQVYVWYLNQESEVICHFSVAGYNGKSLH